MSLESSKKKIGKAMIDRLFMGDGLGVEVTKTLLPRHFDENFDTPIITGLKGGGAATGTEGDENILMTKHNVFEFHIIGGQTIISPVIVATGLDIGQDQTENDGVELCAGILANNPMAFVVGTDPDFFCKATLTLADVSGADIVAVGFRKVEAYQVDPINYDEAAYLNVNAGNIISETIINAGANTATDTTDDVIDTGETTLGVYVSATGVVTFTIDGVAPTVTQAFTFDDGEVLVPFILLRHDANLMDTCVVNNWECGFQKNVFNAQEF